MKTFFYTLFFGIIFFISSCQIENGISPEIKPEATLETFESEEIALAISKKMVKSNTEIQLKVGDFPIKTNISSAPKLVDWAKGDTLQTMNGKTSGMKLNFEYKGHDIAGYYLMINGASSFLDIPVQLAKDYKGKTINDSKGMIRQFHTNNEDDYVISFYIPAEVKSGAFSVSIAAYDTKGFVSNTTTRNIKVVQLGGLIESAFLIQKPWAWRYSISFFGEDKVEKRAGEPWSNAYKLVIPCQEGNLQEIEIKEEFKTDYLKFDFSPNGDFTMKEEGEEKIFDFKNTNCQDIAYIWEAFQNQRNGSWSYDHSHKNLILIFDPKYAKEEDIFLESSLLSFSVEGTNTKEIIFSNETYNVQLAQMVKTANIFSND
ncbi:MAG: hypothetical protein KTR26_13190 [Flammeovirgaceae bacterium]|nr:hypothetical protein [Flammeovirgaceae bacterium]